MFGKRCAYIALTLAVLHVVLSAAGGKAVYPENADVMSPASLEYSYCEPSLRVVTDTAANVITDPAGNLLPFVGKLNGLRSGEAEVVSIVHIGDSHIQAGFETGRLRELFQSAFGNAGRGMITPLRLAGMNEPRDYAIRSPYPRETAKATEKDGKIPSGFNGIAVKTLTPTVGYVICSPDRFNTVTVFHHPCAPILTAADSLLPGTYCTEENTASSTRVVLSRCVDTILLSGFTTGDFGEAVYYGFSLENGNPGVLYHEIGLNGAAFEHFMNNTDFTQGGASALCPDLIIISLGINNCYGSNFNETGLYGTACDFIRSVMASYPGSSVLVTTPMESCRMVYSRGRSVYQPNPNVASAARAIAKAAADSGAACWDMYSAAGGKGANGRWNDGKLFGRDRIHMTEAGYILQADMLYEAFTKYYNTQIETAFPNVRIHR